MSVYADKISNRSVPCFFTSLGLSLIVPIHVYITFLRSIVKLACFLFISNSLFSQTLKLGILAGGSNYLGELQDNHFNTSQFHLAIGGNLTYAINNRFQLRGEVWKGNLSGEDAESDRPFALQRNLNFTSRVYEISLVGQYHFWKPQNIPISLYISGGVAGFRINPYTHDAGGNKNFLFNLSTEGQGISQYPGRGAHRLYHFSIPFGGGINLVVNRKLSLNLDVGIRKTFTDYIDDVSTSYVDATILQQARGAKAVELSYRGDELPGGNPQYPKEGSTRGNPDNKDWYYNTTLSLQYSLFGEQSQSQRRIRQLSCPPVW